MQSFYLIPSTETLTNSRQYLLNNDMTIMSNNSGTVFPTADLQVGMCCVRTDSNSVWVLKDLTPTWIKTGDLTKTYTSQEYVDDGLALKVNGSDVTTTATANKLLKLNSSGILPASITGNSASSSACTGNSATATTALACTGNSATATTATTATIAKYAP